MLATLAQLTTDSVGVRERGLRDKVLLLLRELVVSFAPTSESSRCSRWTRPKHHPACRGWRPARSCQSQGAGRRRKLLAASVRSGGGRERSTWRVTWQCRVTGNGQQRRSQKQQHKVRVTSVLVARKKSEVCPTRIGAAAQSPGGTEPSSSGERRNRVVMAHD